VSWSRLPVRTRLTLWYTGLLLATLLLMCVLSYSLLRRSLVADLDDSLLAAAQAISDTTRGPEALTSLRLEDLLREILGPEVSGNVFRFLDPYGRPRWPSMSRGADALPVSPQALRNIERRTRTLETVRGASGTQRVLTMPVLRDGEVVDIIQVGMPTSRMERTLVRFVDVLVLVLPAAVLLAAVGGGMIARAALRPVDRIAGIARRISAEDLTRRIPEPGTRDELDRLTATLNEMLARLDAAFTQLRRFAADAAHELRTPLTVLRGGLEVALRHSRPPADYEHVLASSLEEVERLVRLAEDLLVFSRATAGLAGERVSIDLEGLIGDATELGVRLGQDAGVTVRVKDAEPVTVRADPRAIRRALLNLIENAIKYTPAPGIVEISLARDGRWARLTVRDSGPGIAAGDVARVFEPFVRLDTARARETGGTGLGLAIARAIVVAHGGTLDLESTPGVGSAFTIRLAQGGERPAEP
jgi:heavy metal sensor kinase